MKYQLEATRFREALNEKGINCAELSRRTGISRGKISGYYNGTHVPSNVTAYKLSQVLEVSPVWIMGFDVPKYDDDTKVDFVAEYDDETLLLIECYNKMKSENKGHLLALAKSLAEL